MKKVIIITFSHKSYPSVEDKIVAQAIRINPKTGLLDCTMENGLISTLSFSIVNIISIRII